MAIDHRHCSLRPNRIGLAFIVLAIAMLLAAINYGNNLVFFISFLLISLMGNSAWQTRRQLNGCRIQTQAIPASFAGDTGIWPVVLTSTLNNPALTILVRDGGMEAALNRSVMAGSPTRCTLPLAPRIRGRHPAPDIQIGTNYPIGLWTARCRVSSPECPRWVYPQPRGHHPLPPAPNASEGAKPQRRIDDETEFDHLRPYVPGDPFNRLAFKQWAKTGLLVTQHREADSKMSGKYIIDYNDVPGGIETRLEQMALWIENLSQRRLSFTLRLPGHGDRVGKGDRHRQACLEALAVFRPARGAVAEHHPE